MSKERSFLRRDSHVGKTALALLVVTCVLLVGPVSGQRRNPNAQEVTIVTKRGSEIPFHNVFHHFLTVLKAVALDPSPYAFNSVMQQKFGLAPDIPGLREFAEDEKDDLDFELSLLDGASKQARRDRRAEVAGEAYGRFLDIISVGELHPGLAETQFVAKIIMEFRTSMSLSYVDEEPPSPDEVAASKEKFDNGTDRVRAHMGKIWLDRNLGADGSQPRLPSEPSELLGIRVREPGRGGSSRRSTR